MATLPSLLSHLGSRLGWLAWAWSRSFSRFSCRWVRVVLGLACRGSVGRLGAHRCGRAHSFLVGPLRPCRIHHPLRHLFIGVVTSPSRSSSVLPALIPWLESGRVLDQPTSLNEGRGRKRAWGRGARAWVNGSGGGEKKGCDRCH